MCCSWTPSARCRRVFFPFGSPVSQHMCGTQRHIVFEARRGVRHSLVTVAPVPSEYETGSTIRQTYWASVVYDRGEAPKPTPMGSNSHYSDADNNIS